MRHKHLGGFTVVELLIYMGIVATISVTAMIFLNGLAKAWGQLRVDRTLLRAGTDSIERLTREMRFAKAIHVSLSSFDVNPGVLELETFLDPSSSGTTTIKFYIQNGQFMLDEGTSTVVTISLTPPNVTVDSFKVWSLAPFDKSTTTSAELIITGGSLTPFQRQETFVTTAVLRGSYEK